MSRTKHHGKNFNQDDANNRRAWGYEYWGKDAYMGADGKKIKKTRRLNSKQILKDEENERA